MTIPFFGTRKDKPSPDAMTLGEHLGELRRRLIICVMAFVVAAMVCAFVYEPILHFLIRPLCNVDRRPGTPKTDGGCALRPERISTCT